MKRKAIPALCAAGLLALALTGCGGGTAGGQAEYIGIDAAKAVALESAGVAEDDAVFSTAGLDKRNGMDYYAVDFTAGGQSYEYDIDAVTGVVIDSSSGGGTAETPAAGDDDGTASAPAAASPSPSAGQTTGGQAAATAVTEEQAREAALSHAGLTADQVTFVRSELDRDDGRLMYDVEFYTSDYKEYDYEIDAATGEILSYDYDAEGYSYQPNATPGTAITAEQARAIALAEVPGAAESDIYEFETDRDDGRLEYEGKIIYNNTEYEFTIDGYSGAIREWDAEPFHR
ncbi:PepSY domain-containing protein [uncultured Flavonifractor sp.]|uniref:PepSY domain-containing protein n=1 Tax=uncultured Flavonifractor sp. TaxID=1193534 RepID=UPI00174D2250|nr:PepSY domain-containing protein [uncultured Flavonifractor sp.]